MIHSENAGPVKRRKSEERTILPKINPAEKDKDCEETRLSSTGVNGLPGDVCPAQPSVRQLPTLAERQLRADKLAACLKFEDFAIDIGSREPTASFLISPKKLPRANLMTKRPSSSGPVKYCTSSDEEGRAGGAQREQMISLARAPTPRSYRWRLDEAESMCTSGSVPSTPRLSAWGTREPSIRVSRAFLRESGSSLSKTHRNHDAPHPPQLPGLKPTLFVPAATSGTEGATQHRSAGSCSGSSHNSATIRHAEVQDAGGSRPPPENRRPQSAASHFSRALSVSVYSLSHATTPRRCPHQAGAGTPRLWSPRAFVDVSDALKERCTSALTSTLRDMPDLNDKHKTKIMDSYCHEVCVALEDQIGLQRENIMICHQQECYARRHSLATEHNRQQQLLHEKLAQRRRDKDKVAAAGTTAAAAAQAVQAAAPRALLTMFATERETPLQVCVAGSEADGSDHADSARGRLRYGCGCEGERMQSGECGDCWALRFNVKPHHVASILNAACTLLVRQAAVLPDLGDRMDAGAHEFKKQAATFAVAAHPSGQDDADEAARKHRSRTEMRQHRDKIPSVADSESLQGRCNRDTSKLSNQDTRKLSEAQECAGGRMQRPSTAISRPVDAALPEGWVVRTSRSTGKSFYYHTRSKNTQWLRPLQ